MSLMTKSAKTDGSSGNADGGLKLVESSLRKLASNMPGVVKFRLLNTLENFDRSFALLERDREIASFRAITGEEEAATALIKALQLRRYPHAAEFNPRSHQHKWALIACVMAIADDVSPMLKEFQLVFSFAKRRVDVKIPLSNFDVTGGDKYAIQPVEPLDLTSRKYGLDDEDVFAEALKNLAKRSNFKHIKEMVSVQANARNTLLYASDRSMPESEASLRGIENRRKRALILLVLAIMILQSKKHQALVQQAILAFLSAISRLPREVTEQ